jgi:hypothetical protein
MNRNHLDGKLQTMRIGSKVDEVANEILILKPLSEQGQTKIDL